VSDSTKARLLHVANGTCTTDILAASGIPGPRSIWADPLYEGPVPAGLNDDELIDVRGRYLSGGADVEAVNDLRAWRRTIEAHEAYDELVLWYEHDLFDQLNLTQISSWLRNRLPRGKIVSLVCVGSFPGHPRFKGLGELSPDELASLFDTRHRISESEFDVAERAWQAFREPAPQRLDSLRQADIAPMPYLAAALERFLQEYPSTIDGLSRTERRLLQLAEPGPIPVADAFPRMHDEEDAYYITDLSLAAMVGTLSRTSPPLLTIVDGSPVAASLHGTVSLTDAGRDVLGRRRDRVACGLDRWLGGVHLQTGADIWRWDDERRRITRR